MNPIETFVLVLSGLLILTISVTFIDEITNARTKTINQADLINIINIYEHGLNLNAPFNATYKPHINGTLVITSDSITLNNESRPYTGLGFIDCDYDLLIINEGGVSCLKL